MKYVAINILNFIKNDPYICFTVIEIFKGLYISHLQTNISASFCIFFEF